MFRFGTRTIGLVCAALTAGVITAQAVPSELERELYRELHRMPPRATLPTPETLACYERLAKVAKFAPLPIQASPAQCATVDLVRLERVRTQAGADIAISPAATMLCNTAEQLALFVRDDLAPAVAAGLESQLTAVTDLDSYQCRGRNNVAGAKLSEHGRANAIDLEGVKLASGVTRHFTDSKLSRPFRERVRELACARFTTVLGPGSDGYHEDHIHVDLAQRSRGYRICQWNVLDPSMTAEVPLPRPRPANLNLASGERR